MKILEDLFSALFEPVWILALISMVGMLWHLRRNYRGVGIVSAVGLMFVWRLVLHTQSSRYMAIFIPIAILWIGWGINRSLIWLRNQEVGSWLYRHSNHIIFLIVIVLSAFCLGKTFRYTNHSPLKHIGAWLSDDTHFFKKTLVITDMEEINRIQYYSQVSDVLTVPTPQETGMLRKYATGYDALYWIGSEKKSHQLKEWENAGWSFVKRASKDRRPEKDIFVFRYIPEKNYSLVPVPVPNGTFADAGNDTDTRRFPGWKLLIPHINGSRSGWVKSLENGGHAIRLAGSSWGSLKSSLIPFNSPGILNVTLQGLPTSSGFIYAEGYNKRGQRLVTRQLCKFVISDSRNRTMILPIDFSEYEDWAGISVIIALRCGEMMIENVSLQMIQHGEKS